METLQSRSNIPSFPASAVNITPNDTTEFSAPRIIEVIADGNLSVVAWGNDETVNISNAPLGYRPGFQVKKVRATGTTATVIGLF